MKKVCIIVSSVVLFAVLLCVLVCHIARTADIRNDKKVAKSMTLLGKDQLISQKMASKFVAGGRSWQFNFADANLTESQRKRIIFDLNLVFGHLSKFEIDVIPSPIKIDERVFDRRVRFEGGENRRPKYLFDSDFGLLEQNSGESTLFVSKSLITAYLKAIELENHHQAEFRQLGQFLARMNEIKEHPIENVRGLFVIADDYKSAEAALAAIPPKGFAEAWGGKHYREPSILDVSATSGTPLEKYGSLIATTYAMNLNKLEDLPLLIFNQGQWRFLLEYPPT